QAPVDGPPVPPDASGQPSRTEWVKVNGLSFVKRPNGSWLEQGDNGEIYLFSESRRNEDYIELAGKTERHIAYRLYSDKAMISRSGGEYKIKYTGRWAAGSGRFVPLLNGQDLNGWVVDSGDPKAWRVEQGELVCRANPANRGWLLTEQSYSDMNI